MSWLFSRALVGAYSEATCSDGAPSAPSSSTPTPQAYLSPDRMTAFSRLSRFGMTFAPLTEPLGEAVWMWCREGSRARTSQPPAREPGSPESAAASGQRWRELSARFDLDSCSWKTHRTLFPEGLPWSSVILPRWGMMRGGVCWDVTMCRQSPRTREEGYGFLPTPSGTTGEKNHVVGRLDEWGGSSNPFRGTSLACLRLPDFEEWMMDWPVSWTELTALETDKFHQWRQRHGGY